MTKFQKGGVRILALFTVLAVLLMTLSFVSSTKATALTNAKDTISDSDFLATATHTITFTTATDLTAGYMIDITFPAGFTTIVEGNVTCPADSTASVVSQVVTCTVDATMTLSAGVQTVTITSVTNPSSPAASYTINILTETDGFVEIESVDVMVAIIDDVVVTATVSSTLTFEIAGLASSTEVNGATTNIDTSGSAVTIPFGTLTADTQHIAGQELTVSTNADDGFDVKVFQNQDLTSGVDADIDCFKDGSCVTTAEAWASPTGTLDSENTYGHFGLTSEDADLSGGDDFGNNFWKGFDGTTQVEVMYHTGPADGTAADKGLTQVAYAVEISDLQEAGDYTNTLTYICTPTY